MKRITLTIVAAIMAAQSFAQSNSGKVVYKETINLAAAMKGVELDGELAAQLADILPKEQVLIRELHFSPEASLYTTAPKKEEKYNPGNGIKIDMHMPEEKIYHDIKKGEVVEQREFMSRKFLITGGDKKNTWKMTGKQKKILNYPCQQATMTKDSTAIIAWFTPAIQVSTGPRELNGLPGLVLEASIDEMFTITATSVEPGAVDKAKLVKPTEGKKMTREQFEKLMKEKAKEMGAEGGNGPNVIIKTERH